MTQDKVMFWRMFLATGVASIGPGEWSMLSQEDRAALVEAGKAKRQEDITALARALSDSEFRESLAQLPEAFADFEEVANAKGMLLATREALNSMRSNNANQDIARSPNFKPRDSGPE